MVNTHRGTHTSCEWICTKDGKWKVITISHLIKVVTHYRLARTWVGNVLRVVIGGLHFETWLISILHNNFENINLLYGLKMEIIYGWTTTDVNFWSDRTTLHVGNVLSQTKCLWELLECEAYNCSKSSHNLIYKCLHISIGSILLLIVIAIGGANKIRVNFAHLGDDFKKKKQWVCLPKWFGKLVH